MGSRVFTLIERESRARDRRFRLAPRPAKTFRGVQAAGDAPVMCDAQASWAMTPSDGPRVHFPRDDGFHADVKRRVAAYFEATGRTQWGGAAMYAQTGLILGWFAASYGLLLIRGGSSAWLAVVLTLSLAFATAAIGFSVMHDANHGATSPSRR